MANIKEYIPSCYLEVIELNKILELESEQLSEAELLMLQVFYNCNIQTCDSDTLSMWEQLLNISFLPDEDLATRRKKVLFTIMITPPFTEVFLRVLLKNYVSDYKLEIDSINCIITLFIIENNIRLAEYIKQLLIPIIPAHMSMIIIVGSEYEINHNIYTAGASVVATIYDVEGN